MLLKYIYENFVPPVEFSTNAEDDVKMLESRQDEETKDQVHSAAYRNIPPSLLRLIDEAPRQDEEEQAHELDVKNELENLVFGEAEEGQMSNKVFGYLLAWNAMLAKIECGRIKA